MHIIAVVEYQITVYTARDVEEQDLGQKSNRKDNQLVEENEKKRRNLKVASC